MDKAQAKARGQGLVEYGFIMVMVAIVVLIVLQTMSPAVSNLYNMIVGSL